MRRVAAAIAAVCLIAAWNVVPALADAKRDRSAVDRELALAKASDAEVEAEATRLAQVAATERGRLVDSQQAQAAAREAADQAAGKLAEVEERAAEATARLARSAVDEYVHPRGQSGLVLLSGASSLDEATRRHALVAATLGETTDALEMLRSVRQDRAEARKALEAASALAAERTTEQAARVKAAEAAQHEQDVAHAELQHRIADLRAESEALVAADAQVQAILAPSRSFDDVAAAPAPSSVGMIWPVRGVVTSEFGPRWGGFHPGLDIAAPHGTPIAAAKAGVVVFAGWNDGGYGNFVVLDNGGGIGTAYAHQSQIAVSPGQRVSQGETIGYVGSTGFSTGDHLHFEVRVNGTAQNPRNYLP